jgi:hypothetical protein
VTLTGPSRTIVVEPVEVPEPLPEREPAPSPPERRPAPDPPEREPARA